VAGEPEDPFLQDRVLAVPEGESEAEPLVIVGDAGQAILAPPVGAGSRVIVGKVAPGGAVRAVVLAHRAPLPLGPGRPPALPGGPTLAVFLQPRLFPCHRWAPSCLLDTTRKRRVRGGSASPREGRRDGLVGRCAQLLQQELAEARLHLRRHLDLAGAVG